MIFPTKINFEEVLSFGKYDLSQQEIQNVCKLLTKVDCFNKGLNIKIQM
jgi:hypothetical protein